MTLENWLILNWNISICWELNGSDVLGVLREMVAEGHKDIVNILHTPMEDKMAFAFAECLIDQTISKCLSTAVTHGQLSNRSTDAEVDVELDRIRNLFRRSH